MLHYLNVILFVAITFLFVPAVLFVVFEKLNGNDARQAAVISFSVSPIFLSFLVYIIYNINFIDKRISIEFLSILITALAAASTIFILKHNQIRKPFNVMPGGPRWLLAILLFLTFVVLLQIATTPMFENDALEYMAVAKNIFLDGSLARYPVVPATQEGLFAPPSHPPAYHMYIVWGYHWLGTGTFLPERLLALHCLVSTLLLLNTAFANRQRSLRLVVAILLLSSPLYVSMLVSYHIDPLRLVAFLAAAIGVARLIDRPTASEAVLAGIVLGLAAFAHSIGILAWAFCGAAWLVAGPADRFRNLRIPLIAGAVALAIGGLPYFRNIYLFGVPLHDNVPVWDMPEVDFYTDMRYRRDLLTALDRALFGVLRGFTEIPLFALLFWLLIPALWTVVRRWRTVETSYKVFAIWIGCYFALAAATALAGTEIVIKNPRYLMTLVPLAIALVAPLLAAQIDRKGWGKRLIIALLTIMPFWMLVQSVSRLSNLSGRLDIVTSGERAPIYRAGDRFPGAPLYRYIESKLRPGEKTLVFRQSDFTLYGTGPWLDNFDTAIEPLYRMTNADEAYEWLRQRHVQFVLFPDYYWPTYSRTVVAKLIADMSLVDEIGSHKGYRLFELREQPRPIACHPVPERDIGFTAWQSTDAWKNLLPALTGIPFFNFDTFQPTGEERFGGPKAQPEQAVRFDTAYGATQILATGPGPLDLPPRTAWSRSRENDEGTDFVGISLEAQGAGFLALDVIQYGQSGSSVQPQVTRLWDGVVDGNARQINGRFKREAGTSDFRVVIRNIGRAPGSIALSRLSICRTSDTTPPPPATGTILADWSKQPLAALAGRQTRIETKSANPFAGEGRLLATPGAKAGWRFAIRSRLEWFRRRLDAYPQATLNRWLRPIYHWAAEAGLPAADPGFLLRGELSATGRYAAFIQYTLPDGRIDWVLAGEFFIAPGSQQFELPVRLPVGAKNFALIFSSTALATTAGDLVLLKAAPAL